MANAATLYNSKLMPKDMVQRRFLNMQDVESANSKIRQDSVEENPMVLETLLTQRLQSIIQNSMAVEQLQQEAVGPPMDMPPQMGEFANRGEPSMMGQPQAMPPMGAEGEGMEARLARAFSQLSTGNFPDNPMANMEQTSGVPIQ